MIPAAVFLSSQSKAPAVEEFVGAQHVVPAVAKGDMEKTISDLRRMDGGM